MRVLVGAAGRFAGAVVPELVKRGARVRALVRDGARAEVARRRGATETVVADLADPATLPGAVHGVDGIFHIGPAFHPREAQLGLAMVAAAREAGVGRFVCSGVIHPSISALVNHAAKQPVEEALYTSGMAFTVLQPAMYLQGLDALWPEVVEHSRLALPYSVTARVCWVDYRDVAEVAALALTRDDLAYGTFELSAPGLVDRVEMAAMIGDELGRRIDPVQVPLQRWASRFPLGPERDGLVRMMAHYDRYGFPGGNELVLCSILGRAPRTLADYIHELATRPASAAATRIGTRP